MSDHNPFPAAPTPAIPSKPFPLTEEQLTRIEQNPVGVPAKLRDELLTEWQDVAQQLGALKDRENRLRKAAVKVLFPSEAADVNVSGTYNFDLGNEWKAKCVFKINYNLDNAKIEDALEQIELCGNEGKFLADRLAKPKYELSVSEYKALDPVNNAQHAKIKAILDGVLTTKPGTPEFSIIDPKAKGKK